MIIRRARDVIVGDVVQINGMRLTVEVIDTIDGDPSTITSASTHMCFNDGVAECFEEHPDHKVVVLESAIPDPSDLDAVEAFLNTNTNP